MPICPKCETEFVKGITICPDCGERLIEQDDFQAHMVNPEDWEVVYTCSEVYEADMLKANLEGAEIETLILPLNDRNFPATGDFTVVKVMVRREQLQDAAQIIQDINSNKENFHGEPE